MVLTPMNERRLSERHPLKPVLACLLHQGEEPTSGIVSVESISAGGLGLYVRRSIPPGDLVEVEPISGPTATRRRLPLRVLHARLDPDGGHLVGCQFLQALSASEVAALAG
jgi:PilZ domain